MAAPAAATELQERTHRLRPVPAQRSARPPARRFQRHHNTAFQRRQSGLSAAADHSAEKTAAGKKRRDVRTASFPLVPATRLRSLCELRRVVKSGRSAEREGGKRGTQVLTAANYERNCALRRSGGCRIAERNLTKLRHLRLTRTDSHRRKWVPGQVRIEPGLINAQPSGELTEEVQRGEMNTQFWVVEALQRHILWRAAFLVGSGLSLIFGVMRIVNLSHGAYFLWGGYIALSVIAATGSWALSLPVAALAVALIGIAMERLFLRSEGFAHLRNAVIALGVGRLVGLAIQLVVPQPIGRPGVRFSRRVTVTRAPSPHRSFRMEPRFHCPHRYRVLRQVLLTVGFAFSVPARRARHLGRQQHGHQPPRRIHAEHRDRRHLLSGLSDVHDRARLGDRRGDWLVMEKTRMGAAVRATVDDAQMARGSASTPIESRCSFSRSAHSWLRSAA